MKTVDQLKPSFAPCYAAAMYPELASIFHKHGYALAVHGSLAKDFDIVAIPWAEKVSSHEDVIKEMTSVFALKQVGDYETKEHGRIAYTFSVGFGYCALDLSFFPVGRNVQSLAERISNLGCDMSKTGKCSHCGKCYT